MRRSYLFALLALAAVAAVVSLATFAQDEAYNRPVDNPEPAGTPTVSGSVVSSSGTSLVISADDGAQMTFTVDSSSSVPSVAKGDRVTVEYHSLSGGKYHAARVTTDTTGMPANTPPAREPSTTETGAPQTGMGYDTDMPRTASSLPLVALIGVLAVGAGLVLRAIPRLMA